VKAACYIQPLDEITKTTGVDKAISQDGGEQADRPVIQNVQFENLP